jgi:hypothetical protein
MTQAESSKITMIAIDTRPVESDIQGHPTVGKAATLSGQSGTVVLSPGR